MDILAHGLWTYAAAKTANGKLQRENRKPLNAWLATFWGIFPDLFAFAPTFAWAVLGLATGSLNFSDLPRAHELEPPAQNAFWAWGLPHQLYNISHSAIIFSAVFFGVWLILKKPVWEFGGWLLHLLIDIPTHSYKFYPTPILWPFSQWKFQGGIAWSEVWFIIVNYSALAVIYFIIWRKRKVGAIAEKN